jgi:isopenicillin-N N-acyltransferase-like protein
MHAIELRGSVFTMGEHFGEVYKEEIAELYELRLANAIRDALEFGGRTVSEEDLLTLAVDCYEISEAFDPAGVAEQVGIARGSGLTIAQITALGGLTDLRDVLSWAGPMERDGGCTGIIRAGSEMQLAQTWDLATDNQPYVVYVHRVPDEGPETWSVTTVGCLSLMGMNEHGLALGTTNLRTLDARPGVPYLNVIHRCLRETNVASAVGVVRDAPRAAAHTFLIADREEGCVVECTATKSVVSDLVDGVIVQTNHCLVPAHQKIESTVPNPSSHARLARMEELQRMEDLREALADTANYELSISRDDRILRISTNAAVLMTPATGVISMVHGPPHQNSWVDMETS